MPYIRCDENCNPVANQPKHTTVKQELSCIEYEVWNGDYIRSRTEWDDDLPALKQPDLKSGWNGDYIQTQADGTQKTGIAQQQVTQSLWTKRDIDNQPAPILCYVRRKVDNSIFTIIDDNKPVGIPILVLQDDRDNVFVTEDHRFRLTLEDNTRLKGGVLPDYNAIE